MCNLRKALHFFNLLDSAGRLSLTNLIVINFVVALTYRMYVFNEVGAGEVLAAIGAMSNYAWKNHRIAKGFKDFIPK